MIKKIKRKKITTLRRGDNVFKSNGISEVKVTERVLEEKENPEDEDNYIDQIVCLEIPIKSSGISELIDDFNRNAPQPPKKDQLIEPDSQIGNQMGLVRKEWVKIPDFADKDYREKKQKHDSDLGIAIVLAGLDFLITEEDGKEITDKDERIKVLKEMGLSSTQFSQLVEDITNLTKWEENEKNNYLK